MAFAHPDRNAPSRGGVPKTWKGAAVFFGAFLRFARWRAALAALLIALGAVFEGMGLLLLVPVLEVATGSQDAGSFSASVIRPLDTFDQAGKLLILLGAFVLLMGVRAVVLSRRDRTINRLQIEFVENVRTGLIGRLAAAPWQTVARVNHARMVQALSVEIHRIGIAANSTLLAAVSLAMLAGYCALALILTPAAGAVAIAFALLGALISRPYLRRARTLGRAVTDAHFGMTGGAMSFLGGLKLAAAEGQRGRFVDEYRAASSTAMEDRLRFAQLQAGQRNVTAMLGAVVGAAVLFVGLVILDVPPAVLIALLVVLSRMTAPALLAQQGAQQIVHSLPAYAAVLSLEDELGRARTTKQMGPASASTFRSGEPIRFENVTFAHDAQPGRKPVIDGVCLTIPAGAFIGIVGPSGVGKTTFLDLAAGLLSPQVGRISAHGFDLSGEALADHQARLGYVTQDSFLFDDTVRRNLAWSRPDCSEAELWDALDLVGARELVSGLADGLDARIGERGVLISAGQRQRLALARAILRRPAILALDEATNAIDIDGERDILAKLAALEARPTILMVAHRVESLAFCDHILKFPDAELSAAPCTPVRKSSSH